MISTVATVMQKATKEKLKIHLAKFRELLPQENRDEGETLAREIFGLVKHFQAPAPPVVIKANGEDGLAKELKAEVASLKHELMASKFHLSKSQQEFDRQLKEVEKEKLTDVLFSLAGVFVGFYFASDHEDIASGVALKRALAVMLELWTAPQISDKELLAISFIAGQMIGCINQKHGWETPGNLPDMLFAGLHRTIPELAKRVESN